MAFISYRIDYMLRCGRTLCLEAAMYVDKTINRALVLLLGCCYFSEREEEKVYRVPAFGYRTWEVLSGICVVVNRYYIKSSDTP